MGTSQSSSGSSSPLEQRGKGRGKTRHRADDSDDEEGETNDYDGLEFFVALMALQQREAEERMAQQSAGLHHLAAALSLTEEQSAGLNQLSGIDILQAMMEIAEEKEEDEVREALERSQMEVSSPVPRQETPKAWSPVATPSPARPPSARPVRPPSVRPWSARSQSRSGTATPRLPAKYNDQEDDFTGVMLDDDDVAELLSNYKDQCNMESEVIEVDRGQVYKSIQGQIKAERLDLNAEPYISFNGEAGLDYGGPRREFFSELLQSLQTSGLFEGPERKVTFTYDHGKLENKDYYVAGVMVAWSVLHTGQGLQCLHPLVYARMVGGEDPNVSISDVPDYSDQENIRRLAKCETSSEIRSVTSELFDWFCSCGVQPATLKLRNRDETVRKLIKHFVYFRVMPAAEEFAKGLDRMGLLDHLRADPEPGRAFFLFPYLQLTATRFIELTRFSFDSIPTRQEIRSIDALKKYLIEVEAGKHPVTLKQMLQFITGSPDIPPGGFTMPIKVYFHDPDTDGRYPRCATCSMEITLPSGLSYDDFADVINEAIRSSPGFGVD